MEQSILPKSSLRVKLQAERLALSQKQVAAKSKVIIEKLKKLIDWRAIKSVHCFVPRTELNEVDTRSFFEFVWQTYPDIATYTTPKNANLQRLHPDFRQEEAKEMPRFDVIVVPMLGFDQGLQRVGYGGGYYDRFLAQQPQAQKIGVCFEIGRLQKLPVEPHDIALDIVVTEKL